MSNIYECHSSILCLVRIVNNSTECQPANEKVAQKIFSLRTCTKNGKTPESGIQTSYRATRLYTKVHLGFRLRFSTLIRQIGRVPRFGAGRRWYIRSPLFRLAVTAFWRALTASWRQKGMRKQRSFLGPLARQNCLRILRP